MAELFFPFDAGAGAVVAEDGWQKMARHFAYSGVHQDYLGDLAVTASGSALAVSVASGAAAVDGFYYENTTPLTVTLDAAHATLPRYDAIVIRLNRTANTIGLTKRTGTPAGSPVRPAPDRTAEAYEVVVAYVLVPAAAGLVPVANVDLTRRDVSGAPHSPTAQWLWGSPGYSWQMPGAGPWNDAPGSARTVLVMRGHEYLFDSYFSVHGKSSSAYLADVRVSLRINGSVLAEQYIRTNGLDSGYLIPAANIGVAWRAPKTEPVTVHTSFAWGSGAGNTVPPWVENPFYSPYSRWVDLGARPAA